MKDLDELEEEHRRVVSKSERAKSKQLERLASDMLKKDEETEKLRKYEIDTEFFDLFK